MTSPTANQTSARLEATFGLGRGWTSQAGQSATVWETPAYHLVWFDDAASDVELRRLWEARKGRQAYPVVLLAPSDDANKVRVAGPQDARPVRELPVSRVLDLLEASRSMAAREAASFLAREFSRLEEAVVPGLRVKDLLTPHFMRERLRRPINEQRLSSAVEGIASTSSIAWRSLFQGMGYQVEQLPQRGYLLRHDNAPVAVVHPHRDASQFSRLTDNGELPEGMVLADCAQHGAHWGVLTAEGRYRLFQRRPPVGPATGQQKVTGEWSLICTGHNLLKLFRFGVNLHRKARVDGPAQRIRNFCRGSEHGAIRKAIWGPAGATGKISCRDPLSLTRKHR